MQYRTKVYIFFVLIAILLSNCDKNNTRIQKSEKFCNNQKFEVIKQLEQEQNYINLSQLLTTTTDETEIEQILLSLSRIDSKNTGHIAIAFINNKSQKIRLTASYVVGQSYDTTLEVRLIKQYVAENINEVKIALLEAIAKCSSEQGLKFIVNLKIENTQQDLLSAQGRSFYILWSKGLISHNLIEIVFEKIDDNNLPHSVKEHYSSIFASKNKTNFELSKYFSIIKREIKNTQNVYYATNLVYALKNISTPENLSFIEQILKSSYDYRIKLAAIEVLNSYPLSITKNIIIEAVGDANTKVSEKAADFLLKNGNNSYCEQYLQLSKKVISWQARTKLLAAALKYSSNKTLIINLIKQSYNAVDNVYEKAALIEALEWATDEYKFIKEQTFSTNDNVIIKAGISTLFKIRTSKNFEQIAKSNPQLNTEFEIIFKEAISSQNSTLIFYAALFYTLYFNVLIETSNTYFINQSLTQLKIPADLETYNIVCQLINKLSPNKCPSTPITKINKIPWDNICNKQNFLKIIIKTNKGDIEAILMPDLAPVTVSFFLEFINKKIYNNTSFYRIIPGKAIICGGKRGDGYDFLNIPIICETSNYYFDEGVIAMRNNFGNYQSSNWFITLAPTFEFNNIYTIFAKISNGLDILHKLEVGDKIISVQIK